MRTLKKGDRNIQSTKGAITENYVLNDFICQNRSFIPTNLNGKKLEIIGAVAVILLALIVGISFFANKQKFFEI